MFLDVSSLRQWAATQGWTVTVDPDGDLRFYDPYGAYVVRCPLTPPDTRRLSDATAALQRAGLPTRQPSTEIRRMHRWTG